MQGVIEPTRLETEFYAFDILGLVGPRVLRRARSAVITAGPEPLSVTGVKNASISRVCEAYLRCEVTPRLTPIENSGLSRSSVAIVVVDDTARPIGADALSTVSKQGYLRVAVVVGRGSLLALSWQPCEYLTEIFFVFGVSTTQREGEGVGEIPIHLTKYGCIFSLLLRPRRGKQWPEEISILPKVVFTVPHQGTDCSAESVEV